MDTPTHEEREVKERWIPHGTNRLFCREYPGRDPAIVLMHGFPDDLHLYDRLIPHLPEDHRVVAFDFLGWGSSDKPLPYPYTADRQITDVAAVVEGLQLERVVLVVHDSSGPPGIDWALDHPDRVAGLVLLNTYYSPMRGMRPPEAILLFSNPITGPVARRVSAITIKIGEGGFNRALFRWQIGRFMSDSEVREEVVAQLWSSFVPAFPAFARLNADLIRALRDRVGRLPELRAFEPPVAVVFGAEDPYLNPRVAERFHELFGKSSLDLIDGANHYVQVDKPAQVAAIIENLVSTGT